MKMLKTMRMRQEKRDILWKEIETEGKWQKRNKHKQTYFRGKGETITRRVKQGDTQKGKIEKTNKKRPNKDMKNQMKKNGQKEEDEWWRKNNSTQEEKQEVRNKEGSTQTMKQKRQDKNDTNTERSTER